MSRVPRSDNGEAASRRSHNTVPVTHGNIGQALVKCGVYWQNEHYRDFFRKLLGKTIKLCTWHRGSARVATCPVLWMCINIDVRVPGAGPDLATPPCIIQTVAGRSGNDPL